MFCAVALHVALEWITPHAAAIVGLALGPTVHGLGPIAHMRVFTAAPVPSGAPLTSTPFHPEETQR
ncbi:hypothetical protein Srufu_013380 [Streptomyces libani subsp. rufus]|nr:hypothetical protein Srufu_013380 [Streptomyces libani subsp. rufus]